MELALFIYLADVVGNVNELMIVLSLLSVGGCFAYIVVYIMDGCNNTFKFNKFVVIVLLIITFFTVVTPSEKTMYMMLAGYTGQNVIQSETASKLHKVIDAKLDEYISEIDSKRSSSGIITGKK